MFKFQKRFISLSKVMPAIGFLFVVGLVLLFSTSVKAQIDDDVIRVETALVQLNVGVTDSKGRSITELSKNDFVVYEDGVKQNISKFAPTTTPFSLVLLLDTSGSTLGFRQNMKFAAARFIDALAPEDRVAVLSFNTKTDVLTKFTSDREKIAYAIEAANGRNKTYLFSALEKALKLLSTEGERRKSIVVITDGIDSEMLSEDRILTAGAKSSVEAIAAVKPEESNRLINVLKEASKQNVTIYPLALPSGDPQRLAEPTPPQIAAYTAARERVQLLAKQTGGRFHVINRLEEMARLYIEVAADLRTLYSISYQPSRETSSDKRWRDIKIEVNRPELSARTRLGYYPR